MLVLFAYLGVAIALLWPALAGIGQVFPGPIGDGTSGLTWRIWAAAQQKSSPFAHWTYLANFPSGEPFWFPAAVQSMLVVGLLWVLSVPFNAIGAYTLVVITGLLFTAFSMFLLCRSYVNSVLTAFLGGLVLGFGTFVTFKLQGNVQWTFIGLIPLSLLLAKRFYARPSAQRAVLMAVPLSLAIYVDWYLTYATVLATATFVVVGFMLLNASVSRIQMIGYVAIFGVVVLAALTPAVAILLSDSRGEPLGLVDRGFESLISGALRPLEFVLPGEWALRPYSDWLLSIWPNTEPLTAVHEAYVGLFAIIGVVALLWGLRKMNNPFSLRLLAPLSAVAIVGLVFSAPPAFELFGITFITPSGLVYSVLPQIRSLTRVAMVSVIALTVLGAMGWTLWMQAARSRRASTLVGALATLFALLDIGFPSLHTPDFTDFDSPPAPYAWLRDFDLVEEGGSVIEIVAPDDVDSRYSSWQMVYEMPLVNEQSLAYEPNSLADRIVNSFLHPQAACLINSASAKFVVHRWDGKPMAPSSNLELLATFRTATGDAPDSYWSNADIYGVARPTLKASAYLAYDYGFTTGTWDGIRGIATSKDREVGLEVFTPQASANSRTHRLNFDARTDGDPEWITLRQGGAVLWQGQVGQDWQRIEFEAQPGIVLISRNPGDATSGDAPQSLWVGRFGAGDCE